MGLSPKSVESDKLWNTQTVSQRIALVWGGVQRCIRTCGDQKHQKSSVVCDEQRTHVTESQEETVGFLPTQEENYRFPFTIF